MCKGSPCGGDVCPWGQAWGQIARSLPHLWPRSSSLGLFHLLLDGRPRSGSGWAGEYFLLDRSGKGNVPRSHSWGPLRGCPLFESLPALQPAPCLLECNKVLSQSHGTEVHVLPACTCRVAPGRSCAFPRSGSHLKGRGSDETYVTALLMNSVQVWECRDTTKQTGWLGENCGRCICAPRTPAETWPAPGELGALRCGLVPLGRPVTCSSQQRWPVTVASPPTSPRRSLCHVSLFKHLASGLSSGFRRVRVCRWHAWQ